MTHMKAFGNKHILMFVLLAYGCATTKPSGYNVSQYNDFYINDSLQISIGFYGNHIIVPVSNAKHAQRKIKKKINCPFSISAATLLCYTIPQKKTLTLEDFLFFSLNESFSDTVLEHKSIKSYKGLNFYFDTVKRECYYPFSSKGKKYLYITREVGNDNSTFNLFQLLISTYGVTQKIRTDKDYLQDVYENPYSLAYNELNYPTLPNYLSPITALQKEIVKIRDDGKRQLYDDAFAQYFSLVDNTDSALYHYYKAHKEIDTKKRLPDSLIETKSAFNHILNTTKNYDIVAFNENHSTPLQRYYLATLLSDLKQQGFENIGFEAIATDNIDSLKQSSYGNGFYTLSPSYNFLIKYALEIGMKIFSYEDTMSYKSFEQRDKNQAINILNKLREKKGKTIRFCGFGHIQRPQLSDSKFLGSMSYNLEKMSLKKILTVDLEYLSTNYNSSSETYSEPRIFKGSNDFKINVQMNPRNADISIFLPPNSINKFKEQLGFKKTEIAIPNELSSNQQKIVGLWKYPNSNPLINSPAFLKIVKDDINIKDYLETGNYSIIVMDSLKKILYKNNLSVE